MTVVDEPVLGAEHTLLSRHIVSDELWQLVEPLLPGIPRRPQGGGRSRGDQRSILVAVVFVLTSGKPWRALPDFTGVNESTAYRWFQKWTTHGLFATLRDILASPTSCPEHLSPDTIRWAGEIADAAIGYYANPRGARVT